MPRILAASAGALMLAAGIAGPFAERTAAQVGGIARVEAVTGIVAITNRDIAELKTNEMVRLNDIVKTTPTSAARVTFGDGSAMLVEPDTEVSIAKHDPATQQTAVTLAHGLVLVQVTPGAKEGWSQIEGLDEKHFFEEFTKLVRKNYDTQKKKWDKAAQDQTNMAGQDMWRLVQTVLH